MAFAKAEALTMVCMKNRFWTLIAKCVDKKRYTAKTPHENAVFLRKCEEIKKI